MKRFYILLLFLIMAVREAGATDSLSPLQNGSWYHVRFSFADSPDSDAFHDVKLVDVDRWPWCLVEYHKVLFPPDKTQKVKVFKKQAWLNFEQIFSVEKEISHDADTYPDFPAGVIVVPVQE